MICPTEFRRRRRAYGVRVPTEEISAHLACGWRLADPDEAYHREPFAMLAPPAALREVAA